MSNITAFVKEHPMAVVGAVVLIAFVLLSNKQSSTVAIAQPAGDPNAGAEATQIELARIGANQANFSAVTTLFGTEGQTAAARDVALHQIDAAQEVQDTQTAAGVTVSKYQTDAALAAEQNTNQTQLQIAQTAAGIASQQATLNYQNQQTALQYQKDIARAADNTQIVNGFFGFAGNLVKGLFSWF